jgi:hypothetical protein
MRFSFIQPWKTLFAQKTTFGSNASHTLNAFNLSQTHPIIHRKIKNAKTEWSKKRRYWTAFNECFDNDRDRNHGSVFVTIEIREWLTMAVETLKNTYTHISQFLIVSIHTFTNLLKTIIYSHTTELLQKQFKNKSQSSAKSQKTALCSNQAVIAHVAHIMLIKWLLH